MVKISYRYYKQLF